MMNRPFSSSSKMIRVVAPAKLEEGFTFDVIVNDAPFTVVVPEGGVKEGQEFDVRYAIDDHDNDDDDDAYSDHVVVDDKDEHENEDDDETLPIRSSSEEEAEYDKLGVPMGRWRTTLCTCCEVLTQATFWMGCCCTPVLVAQLLTRFRLTWKGQKGSPEETSLSFNRIVISLIIVLAISKVPLLGSVVMLGFFVFVVVYVGANVRRFVRRKYKIPSTLPTKYGDMAEDCCCMLWCGCCSVIQIARHTHDDKEYPGYGCTTTGLEISAPMIQ